MNRMLGRMLITVALAALGAFFVASGYQLQTFGPGDLNIFGQLCLHKSGCIRPVWIGVGSGILVAAFLFYRHRTELAPPPPGDQQVPQPPGDQQGGYRPAGRFRQPPPER